MNDTLYDGHDELYHHAKFGEDRTTLYGCRCENMVFVFFVFFLLPAGCREVANCRCENVVFFCLFVSHASSPEHRAFEGCIVRTSIALPFIDGFRGGLLF